MRNEDVQVFREIPAASSACWATFAISKTAQRNTAWPSWVMAGNFSGRSAWNSSHATVCLMVSDLSPSEPQTVGPMAAPWRGRR